MLREYLTLTMNICSKREYFLCSFLTHKRCSRLQGEEEEEKSMRHCLSVSNHPNPIPEKLPDLYATEQDAQALYHDIPLSRFQLIGLRGRKATPRWSFPNLNRESDLLAQKDKLQ